MTAAIAINLDPAMLFSEHWGEGLALYAAIPIFIILYFGYKWKYNTKIIPLEEVDLSRENNIWITIRIELWFFIYNIKRSKDIF